MEYIWIGGEWERIEGVRKRTDVPLQYSEVLPLPPETN
jgi:hypothetical protein